MISVKLAPLIVCQGLVRLGGLGDGVRKEDALDGVLRRVEQGPGPALHELHRMGEEARAP